MNFFENHHWFLLVVLAFFPRIALVFFFPIVSHVLWWLGWLVCPHLLVAVLALPYYDSNPALVIFSWCWGIIATSYEGRNINITITKNAESN